MKFGMRTPSLKRSISARTTGRLNRAVKKAIIPGYGRKGMGILHPKKALYNQVYRRTTFSIFDLAKAASGNKRGSASNAHVLGYYSKSDFLHVLSTCPLETMH